MVLATAMSVTYLVVLIPAQDFASGDFRARLAASGARLWNNMWFGGHPLPAYGMLSAFLSGWAGARVVAACSVVVATWGFSHLVKQMQLVTRGNATVSTLLFAACVGVNTWAGRLTFAPSVAFGVLALVALNADRRLLGVLASCACALASPVGGVFLLLILGSLWLNQWKRRATVICAISCAVPLAVMLLLFSEGGWFPFRWQSLLMVVINVGILAWVARRQPIIRTSILLYAALVAFAFLVKSPLGGNVVRLAWLATGALGVLFVSKQRRIVVFAISVLTLVWNGVYLPIGRPLSVASADSSFYAPVAKFMSSVPGVHKVEVVSTNVRRESDLLAMSFPLARGWQTQIDRDRNALFYSNTLTAAAYLQWLQDNAVSFVAVPKKFVHSEAQQEAAIAASMASDLGLVFEDTNWRIYEVLDAEPLATNSTDVVGVSPEQLHVRASRTGWTTIRFRFTPMYKVTAGDACVGSTDDGWIRLNVRTPGDVTLTVKFTLSAALRRSVECG